MASNFEDEGWTLEDLKYGCEHTLLRKSGKLVDGGLKNLGASRGLARRMPTPRRIESKLVDEGSL